MEIINQTERGKAMLSYHNDPAVKEKYVRRFEAHRAADQVIQGIGFNDGRGCFVGCTLDDYNHEKFPTELGWPVWLARLADQIFEGLPKEDAPQFGTDLLSTVPVGMDLEPVQHMLAIRRLDRLINLQLENKGYDASEVISALQVVRQCHQAEIQNNVCDWSAWSAAESARSAAVGVVGAVGGV